MASPARRAIAQRKLAYVIALFVLFVVTTFFWRGVASPLTGGKVPEYTVSGQANNLELTDLSTGDADLTGSAIRLMLTGSRGLALSTLWYQSDEKKKRHEWNKLELLVRTITKLTPHSPAPWTFQSWNIAYNVSVESDRVADKFFYIAKGIQLMAEGIRLNKDQPDMRYMMGFYYQNKFGITDEVNTLRCLMQLSCIDPRERDAARMKSGGKVDAAEFEKFATKNPQLVRRLKEKLNYTPSQVVDFLRDNRNVPSRFYDPNTDGRTGAKPLDAEQFPTLPMEVPKTETDVAWQGSILKDDFDGYQAGRSWMTYAQDPLPEPSPQTFEFDRLKMMRDSGKRIPRAPMLVIFRHLPARAQSYVGERLEKEGWFDETGWDVDGDRVGLDRWFATDKKLVLGTGTPWAEQAWSRSFLLWQKHGKLNGLQFDTAELIRLNEKARPYRERYHIGERDPGKDITDDNVDADLKESFRAHRQLYFYESNRSTSNFDHHYFRAMAEKDPETIQARKAFFHAQRFRKEAEPNRSIQQFEQGFELWKKAVLRHREFRDDMSIQEDAYELQLEYLDLLTVHRGGRLRPTLVVDGMLAQGLATMNGLPMATLPSGTFWGFTGGPKQLPFPIVGPLDQIAPDGRPWIDRSIAINVLSKQNRLLETGTDEQPPASPRDPRAQ